MSFAVRWLGVAIVTVLLGTASAADPPVRLTEDGTALLYRAQPGDLPAEIAARFGIGPSDVAAFLAANGIDDPTRVAVGKVYRIPNPLAVRASEAEARAESSATGLAEAERKVQALTTERDALGARVGELERESARLVRLARIWPWAKLIGLVLFIALAIAGYVAYQAATKMAETERYAHDLGEEVDHRRQLVLAERQKAARHAIELEARIELLERELRAPTPHRPTGTH